MPLKQSELLVAALKEAGADVTFRVVQGAGHGGPAFSTPGNMELIEDSFAKHLREGRW